MSAFVCIFERTGRAVDPDLLNRLAASLEFHGTGVAIFHRGPIGIAIRHAGDPGSDRRHGPLEDSETGRIVAVSGRFNPVAGQRRGNAPKPPEGLYGAAFHAAHVLAPAPGDGGDFIDDFLAGVSGAFVLLVAQLGGGGSIEVARDHLGSCKLYYRLDSERLIAASEPTAILSHNAVSSHLDEGSIARFLGFRFGLSEQSYFRGIRELPPAHSLSVSANDTRTRQYWRFSPPADDDPSLEGVCAAFRRRLGRALADEVAGLEPRKVALSLSGGLDSTALAALAPKGVQAFSWTFDDTPAGDERQRVEQVSRHLDLPVQWVPGDGLHPLCDDFMDRFVDENSPYLNPFSALKLRLYEAAREAGCQRVLVGDGGDALFAASEYWLRDSLRDGEPRALRSLAGAVSRAARGDRFSRRAVGRALRLSRPSLFRRHPAPWLTTIGRDLLPDEKPSPILPLEGDPARHELSVGFRNSELESEERRLFARCQVERGNPFWSWPLLEFTIHLPAHWYHRDTRSKVLTRESLRGLLPQEVLESGGTGSLGRFFLRGLELRQEELRDAIFRRPQSDWTRYVRRDWVEPFLAAVGSIRFGHTILWRVIAYEFWYRRLLTGGGWHSAAPERGCPGRLRSALEAGFDELSGVVHGVELRGRLPASFKPYLLPTGDRAGAADSLEVSYRPIDELPKLQEIWVAPEDGGPSSGSRRFSLVRQSDGFGLLVADQGRGLFRCGQRRIGIEWTAGGTGAAHYFFSYALPLWLESRGVPVLHASAVLMRERAVGFVGPSGVGKSVLAADLARLGCGLLADDGLALRADGAGGWRVFRGPPLLRLWPSALRLLEVPSQGLPRVHETLEKRQLSLPAEWGGQAGAAGSPQAAGVRLAAIYLLERQPAAESAVAISEVARDESLVRLIEHSVAAAPAAVLGLSAQRFELLADVVESVPVRRLRLSSGDSASRIRDAILQDLGRAAS